EQTISETLKANGYVTGLFGKFHLGSAQPGSPCNPGAMGFDEWIIGLNFFDNNPYLSRNGKIEHRTGKGSVILMDDALSFIEKHTNGSAPLFTVIWFPSPHYPHAEIQAGPNPYEGKPHEGYWQEITLLDQQLGRLRSNLRRMGIAENTILWYCSDNGGLVKESSGGRAKKGSIYEGGLRVPALLEWPAQNLRGRTSVPVCTSDMYPTLMAMAGIDIPGNTPPLDGMDVRGIIAGNQSDRGSPIGFWHHFEKGQSTRSDQLLKEIMRKQQAGTPRPHNEWRIRKDTDQFPSHPEDIATGHAAWTDWPWKLHRINGTVYELYNLEEDPTEQNDLSTDPAQQARLAEMKAGLMAWMRSVIRSMNGQDYRP
ncbi:MAG: sulfatase-like hydrolase/transferase, partial [Saprospiraceae bacterium]|nr:sulfatase-like hydrolase/transferase [Saprospiraceae bacterium]